MEFWKMFFQIKEGKCGLEIKIEFALALDIQSRFIRTK